MFYPKCPKCGSESTSAEGDSVSYGNRHLKRFASGHMTGHGHPLIGMFATAISVGNMIYQRVPGGGRKRCTNPSCRHEFS